MKDAPGFFEKLRGYGDIAYFRFAWHHDYLVNTPELIREVLITKAEHFNKQGFSSAYSTNQRYLRATVISGVGSASFYNLPFIPGASATILHLWRPK